MNFLWQFKFFCLQWFIFDKYFCWIDLHSFFDWFLNIFQNLCLLIACLNNKILKCYRNEQENYSTNHQSFFWLTTNEMLAAYSWVVNLIACPIFSSDCSYPPFSVKETFWISTERYSIIDNIWLWACLSFVWTPKSTTKIWLDWS